jgi:hypothetical protein
MDMGKTAFSGPVYGAKSLIFSYSRTSTTAPSTAVFTFAQAIVPTGQDWYVTDFHAFRESTHSTAFTLSLSDDSSRATSSTRTIASVAIASSAAGSVGSTIVTADAGEYEGKRVASGSTVTLQLANGGSSVTGGTFTAWAYGFIRFVSSTRSE